MSSVFLKFVFTLAMKIRLHPFLLPSTRWCTCTAENLWKWRLLHSLLFSAGFKPRNQIQREASIPLCQTLSTSFTFSHTELFTGRPLSVSGWICSGLAVLSLPLVANQKHVPRTLRGHFFPLFPSIFIVIERREKSGESLTIFPWER